MVGTKTVEAKIAKARAAVEKFAALQSQKEAQRKAANLDECREVRRFAAQKEAAASRLEAAENELLFAQEKERELKRLKAEKAAEKKAARLSRIDPLSNNLLGRFVAKIQKELIERNISRAQLAEKSGIALAKISYIFCADSAVRVSAKIATLEKLEGALENFQLTEGNEGESLDTRIFKKIQSLNQFTSHECELIFGNKKVKKQIVVANQFVFLGLNLTNLGRVEDALNIRII